MIRLFINQIKQLFRYSGITIIFKEEKYIDDFIYVKDVVQANFLVAEKGGEL